MTRNEQLTKAPHMYVGAPYIYPTKRTQNPWKHYEIPEIERYCTFPIKSS